MDESVLVAEIIVDESLDELSFADLRLSNESYL